MTHHGPLVKEIIFLFSAHSSQPEVSKYCADLMPLLLGYLSSLNEAKIGHVTKAFYALENFMENLGKPKSRKSFLTGSQFSMIFLLYLMYFLFNLLSRRGY